MPSQAPASPGPDPEHFARVNEGVEAWNRWRADNPEVLPDLRNARLEHAKLPGIDLHSARLQDASLAGADLAGANLVGARIERTIFNDAHFGAADLRGVMGHVPRFIHCDLRACQFGGGGLMEALIWDTDLSGCDLRHMNFKGARFNRTQMDRADFRHSTLDDVEWYQVQAEQVCLEGVSMKMATISESRLGLAKAAGVDLTGGRVVHTDLRYADLRGANLQVVSFVNVALEETDISESRVFGVAAWHLLSSAAHQRDLIITPPEFPTVSCDDLETAQFIYLILQNQKLRQVIDAVGRKAVLLLGRFTPERKAVLDALRNTLRTRGFVPMLFDFDKPADRDITETVSTLAHLARFVIADLTDPRSIPQELKAIVQSLPSVPVQPLLLESQDAYAMFADLGGFASVLPPVRYRDLTHLLEILDDRVVGPAERRIEEIRARRAAFEAGLSGH